jgi:hypothetical protein
MIVGGPAREHGGARCGIVQSIEYWQMRMGRRVTPLVPVLPHPPNRLRLGTAQVGRERDIRRSRDHRSR